jgi:hypothetical protein
MEKINLVITCYDGTRRQKYNNSISNLKLQNFSLNHFKHSISQVTLVCTTDSDYSDGFLKQLDEISKSDKYNTQIIYRENIGASYGSFNHVYTTYRQEFDQYIFLEDDYVFGCDYFDEILLNKMFICPQAGYICSYADKTQDMHAAISVGMMSSHALESIWQAKGKLAFAGSNTYKGLDGHEYAGQYLFSKNFLDLGFKIYDCSKDYDAWFFSCEDNENTIMCFSETLKNKNLMAPTQIFCDLLYSESLPIQQSTFLTGHYNYPTHSCPVKHLKFLDNYMRSDLNFVDVI